MAAMRCCLCDHAASLDLIAGGGVHAARVAGVADWSLRDEGVQGITPQQDNIFDCLILRLRVP